MPNDFPIMYFAEKIASEPFHHVIECINVSDLTYILVPDPKALSNSRTLPYPTAKLTSYIRSLTKYMEINILRPLPFLSLLFCSISLVYRLGSWKVFTYLFYLVSAVASLSYSV